MNDDTRMSDIINKFANQFAYEEFRREQLKDILNYIYTILGTICTIKLINALVRGRFKL